MDLLRSDGNLTESEKFSRLQSAFTVLLSTHAEMRREQIVALRTSVGKIVDDEIKEELRRQKRPILEYPIPQQTLLYIAGKLQTDMKKFKAVPAEEGKEGLADLATKRNEWAMEVSRGYQNMARAGMHSAIAKRGWVNIYWDTTEDPRGTPVIAVVDPMLVMSDPDPGQNRFVCYFPMVGCEELIRIYSKYLDDKQIETMREKARNYEPRTKGSDRPVGWFERMSGDVKKEWNRYRGVPTAGTMLNEWMDASNGLYRLVEYHDIRREIHKFAYSPRTQGNEIIPMEYSEDTDYHSHILGQTNEDGSSKYPDGFIHEVSVDKIFITSICPSLLPDRLLVEQPHPIQGEGFQLKKIDCYDWHPDPTKVQSIMDSLNTPAKFWNHNAMSMMALMKKALNPGVDAETESINPADIDDWQSGKDGIVRWYVKGRNRPEERQVASEAFKLAGVMAETSKDMVEFLSGIGQSAKGYQESSGESGILYQRRVSQTEVMIAYFFSQMTELGHDVFMYVDKLMDVFLTTERKLSLTGGTDGPQWMMVNTNEENTLGNHEFNYVPDIRSIGETQRAEKFLTMSTMLDKVQGDPVLSMYVLMIMTHFLDIPEGKEFENFIKMRLGQMLGAEGEAKQTAQDQGKIQDAAAKLQLAATAKELMSGKNGKPKAKKAA